VVCFARRGRHYRRHRDFRQYPPVRPPEAELTIRLSFHLEPLFVNRAMVPPTEHREIRQLRWAALRPVADVMALTER